MEIVSDVKLITAGDKVGASEATLLAKLGIKPFSYGLIIRQVWSTLPCLSVPAARSAWDQLVNFEYVRADSSSSQIAHTSCWLMQRQSSSLSCGTVCILDCELALLLYCL